MSVIAERGNVAGKANLTNAVNAATAATGCILIRVDITDILAMVGVSADEKKKLAFQRAQIELNRSIDSLPYTDAALDQRVADTTAEITALKAARPTGGL